MGKFSIERHVSGIGSRAKDLARKLGEPEPHTPLVLPLESLLAQERCKIVETIWQQINQVTSPVLVGLIKSKFGEGALHLEFGSPNLDAAKVARGVVLESYPEAQVKIDQDKKTDAKTGSKGNQLVFVEIPGCDPTYGETNPAIVH